MKFKLFSDEVLHMVDALPVTISVLALTVSVTTAWLTLFHRGTVRMTRPTQIFFGTDSSGRENAAVLPKIYLRALMFATSKRGRIVENIHVLVTRNDTPQVFNIWVYGGHEKLARGSGLFVGEAGVEANHHFLLAPDVEAFAFATGRYRLDVFAHVLGDKQKKLLFSDVLEVTQEAAAEMRDSGAGLYFDWAPDVSRYISHVKRDPSRPVPWNLESFARRDQNPE
ncbi:hypothetical protein [Collimonas pratensis]|uniref:hypothetical protein n=1 Tax=Collimonas pratensis TaxID=279113 RepID=UPI000780B481|nr:hypothetical protein [Collimonas pratensis]